MQESILNAELNEPNWQNHERSQRRGRQNGEIRLCDTNPRKNPIEQRIEPVKGSQMKKLR
jgi:hypothetical protein